MPHHPVILSIQTTTYGAYGGIPTYNRCVCRALNDSNLISRCKILIATDEPADIQDHSNNFSHLELKGFSGNRPAFVVEAVKIALSERIDLALIGHVNYAPLGLLLKCLQPQMRYGVIAYGIEVWSMLSPFKQQATRSADFVAAISNHTKQRLVEINGIDAKHVYVLPNALDWDVVGNDAPKISEVRAKTTLLSVCRLERGEKYKGIDHVIEALPRVIARVPDLQYFIIGSGDDLDRHKNLARERGVSGRVHFLGNVDPDTLRSHYQSCDLFVMPSAREGFGFVFLEAMSYGKAVIAANSGAAPEVVKQRVTGLLTEYGDREQIAEAIVELCIDPAFRQKLGAAGLERLQNNFTFEHFEERLESILLSELPAGSVYKSRRRKLDELIATSS